MIFLVVLAALTVYVATPLYRPDIGARSARGRAELEARRDTLIWALRELELDHATGGVEEVDYGHERQRLEAEAANVFRTLAASPGEGTGGGAGD